MKIKGYSPKIIELDGIRGAACLFVLIHHYFTGILTFELKGFAWVLDKISATFFLSGVDLFFVLSGFLVGGIIIDSHKDSGFLKVFFIRRVCRIFPVYFGLIFSYLVGLYFLKNIGFFKDWLLLHPLPSWSYLTYFQSYLMGIANDSGAKWVAVTWSVSVEEQFYLMTPFIFLIFGARKSLWGVISVLVIAPVLRAYVFNHLGFYAGYMFFPTRMDTISWGVLLAFALRSDKWRALLDKNTKWVIAFCVVNFALVTAQSLTLLHLPEFAKFSFLAMFYVSLMWAVLEGKLPKLAKIFRWKFLTFTGLISYAMYMFHQLTNGLVHGFIFNSKPLVDGWPRFGATLLSVMMVYLGCYLSLVYFETPIRSFGAKFKYGRPKAEGDAGPKPVGQLPEGGQPCLEQTIG